MYYTKKKNIIIFQPQKCTYRNFHNHIVLFSKFPAIILKSPIVNSYNPHMECFMDFFTITNHQIKEYGI